MTDGTDRTFADIADALGTTTSEVSRILPLAFLSPQITRQILEGSQPNNLTARRLSRMTDIPHSWKEQDILFHSMQ